MWKVLAMWRRCSLSMQPRIAGYRQNIHGSVLLKAILFACVSSRRAARSAFGGGGLPRPSKALVFAEPGGGAGPEGEVRTGAGPLCSLSLPLPRRHPRPLDGPTPWARRDAPRGSYNFPETSAGAGKLQRVPAARVPLTAQWPGAGLTAEEYVMGAFGSFPGPMAPAPPLPPLRSFGLAPALPRACIPRPTGQERIQMRRFRKAQLGTQRSVTVSGLGARAGFEGEGGDP